MRTKKSIAGLRNTADAVARLPGHLELGAILSRFFMKMSAMSTIAQPTSRSRFWHLAIGESRRSLARSGQTTFEARQGLSKILSCSDSEPVANEEECSTDIRAYLLQRCATVARDPGVGVCRWLTYGASAGLVADPNGIDDVFPRTLPTHSHDQEDRGEEECVAHSSAANDPAAEQQIQEYAQRGRKGKEADDLGLEGESGVATGEMYTSCGVSSALRSGPGHSCEREAQSRSLVLCSGLHRRFLADLTGTSGEEELCGISLEEAFPWSHSKAHRARSQLYVDDPVISVCGTDEFCDDATATEVAIWKITGSQRGDNLIWIRGHNRILEDRVIACNPEGRRSEVRDMANDILKANVVSINSFRTSAGKASPLRFHCLRVVHDPS